MILKTIVKKLGIWMDHSSMHIIEFSSNPVVTKTIESKFTRDDKMSRINSIGTKILLHQTMFYKQLGEIIRHYEEVILFGPTVAKNELLNTLSSDQQFEKTKITVVHADKMSKEQQYIFVRDYFSETILDPEVI